MSLVDTATSVFPLSYAAASDSSPEKIQIDDRISPAPAAPARSSRCRRRTASLPARSPVSGETPSSLGSSSGWRLRFRKSARDMGSPSSLGNEVGGGRLPRRQCPLSDRNRQDRKSTRLNSSH